MARKIINSFMRFFLNILYHGMAFSYDLVADVVSLGRWKSWVYSVIPELNGDPVIELGHGPGHLQKELLSHGRLVFGLDESRQMSALARRRLDGLSFRLARADARRLPLASASVNRFAATFPSEYILHPDTAAELSRVLIPGGEVVILLAAWPGGSSIIERAVRRLFRITGESPPEDGDYSALIKLWADNHLIPEIKIRECGNSRLLLVFLRKSPLK